MAKRSDFAQKLLDDLRVRKERMAAASHHHQNSRGSRPAASDTYTYSKPTTRSSRDMRAQQTTGTRTATGHNRHSSSNRSISMDNNTKQLVPVRRGQQQNHHQQVGDLTMALTFAIENGAKLGRMDAPGSRSMLNFLHQISKRSVDWGNMQKPSNIDIHFSSSSHLPALSNHHIREISKGAQRLNQILRACSNGHNNFDTYSVEIGKELLKGAMDLQESLRMLVNLQEGSEYTVTPQRKGRIKLLDEEGEEEEDDDDKAMKGAIQMKQIALPRFSFDRKPSRTTSSYSKEATRSDLKQRVIMALPYSPEGPEKVSGVSNSSFLSHKRSSSRVSSVRNPTVPETRNQSSASKPKPEKKRISNVVAKLMGLEELPENEDVVDGTMEKEGSSKKKNAGSIVVSPEKGNENRRKTKDVENLVPPPGRKQKQVMQEETYALQPEQHDGRQIHKDVEGINPMRGSNMANMKIDKQHSNNTSSQLNRSVKDTGEKEWKHNNAEVKRGQKVEDFEDMIPRHDQYQMVMVPHPAKSSESAWPGQTESMAEKRGTNKQISSNRVKGYQNQLHPSLAQNVDSKDMKQQKTQMKRQEPVQRNQAAHHSKSDIESEDASNSKRVGLHTSTEHLEPARSPATAIVHKQDSRSRNLIESLPSKDLKSDNTMKTKKRIPSSGSGKEEKPVRLPATEKVKTTATKAQKVETARRIDELAEKRRGASQKLPNAPLMKHQASPTFPQKKQRGVEKKLSASKEANKERSGKFKEPKVPLVKSKKPATSIQQAHTSEDPQTETGEALKFELHDNLSDDGASLKGPEVPASPANIVPMETGNQEDQEPNNGGRDEQESEPTISDSVKGTHKDKPETDHLNQQLAQEDQKAPQQKKQLPKPLTEAENHLKQILVKNQRFLDTAEALFRLNIPIEILNVSDAPDPHNPESKLTADCGYEVMKRKGKRQELLRTHRSTKLTLNSTAGKRKSLDGLISQLCNDLETLRFYGRNGNAESGIEDYLPKMLEADVCSTEPDVNSMWEIGWEKPDLKFPEQEEVVREVEKIVLNGLLDELAGDLLAVF